MTDRSIRPGGSQDGRPPGTDLGRREVLELAAGGTLAGATFPATVSAEQSAGTSAAPEVVSASVEHVGGTEPEMDAISVETDPRGTRLEVGLRSTDSGNQPPIELATAGADHSTTFEVTLELAGFSPHVLSGRSNGLRWDRTIRDDGTAEVVVEARPITFQVISGDVRADDWPTGEADRADHATDQRVSFGIRSFADHDGPIAQSGGGLVVGSDAMSIFTPAVRNREGDPRLEITVASPHYTVSGEVNEGFYYAVLPPSLLAQWDVSGPGQLAAWYDGEKADFSAERVGESILVELDVRYSVRTIGVGPGEPLTDPTGNSDESTEETGDGSDESTDEVVPGFGVVGTLTGLGGAGYALARRSREDE